MEDNIFDNELGRKILALIRASFKVSDLISDLVLREKIKQQILNVYKNFPIKNYQELLKELDILDGLFYLAGYLNFAREDHVKSLRNGIIVFKSHIVLMNYDESKYLTSENEKNHHNEKRQKPEFKLENQGEELTERQGKIMKYFNDKETVKFTELAKLFPHVSEKTVRNDLSYLIDSGKLVRLEKGTYERK